MVRQGDALTLAVLPPEPMGSEAKAEIEIFVDFI
jgi:hypothetical protein